MRDSEHTSGVVLFNALASVHCVAREVPGVLGGVDEHKGDVSGRCGHRLARSITGHHACIAVPPCPCPRHAVRNRSRSLFLEVVIRAIRLHSFIVPGRATWEHFHLPAMGYNFNSCMLG